MKVAKKKKKVMAHVWYQSCMEYYKLYVMCSIVVMLWLSA